ncbi:hypothetical protein CERZMDRAFT_95602 [Cercospora zeae-maydis SCOH1-5]|uniref:Uncharacterized protein n=1 Tax=Cercospora zeae-maydis SCOH1-5 TaxID=717836 RepID=A0A6A6FLJ8_9PEZI|nr:hypothetical protein CERZMDRAFT_95602 [Cercospora zeae-maydis SCOH1-5]
MSSSRHRRRHASESDPLAVPKHYWPWTDPSTRHLYASPSPVEPSKRPKWEPMVQHAAWKIEQCPRVEETALRSLQRQGCQHPLKHYYPEHECQIPNRRLQCLREIRRWQRDRPLVLIMAEKLPKELVLQILEHMALDTMDHVYLQDETSIITAARRLLGESLATEALMPLSLQAVLEQSILSIDVDVQRTERGRVAILPSFVPVLPHPVRKARLTLDFEIPIGRQKYPAIIYTTKAGMASLLSQLPGLRVLHIFLNIELTRPPWDHRGSALDVGCRKGFSGTTTFRFAIQELLEAARIERPTLDVFLEIKYLYEGTWRGSFEHPPETYNVAMEAMTAEAVLREADAKWSQCRFSQG